MHADAVVIGAGAFGLSVAWHLWRQGAGEVVVLDRFAPASQTSPRAAGLFKLVQADEMRSLLAQMAIDIVTSFEERTGVPLAVERSGSLLLARTPEHGALIKREARQSAAWGVALEPVDGATARRLAPVLESEELSAAVHIPGDVYIEEPRYLLDAWLAALERAGVAVYGHTPVTGIEVRAGAIAAVVTSQGRIETPLVVDAAGAWARVVGALAGGEVPVVPVRHQLAITQPLAGVEAGQPILRFVDSAVYIRPCRGGLMVGGFEADPLPVDPRRQPAGFSIDDVPLDLAVVERLAAMVRSHVPSVLDVPLAEHRGGLFTMTADGSFLAGPVPGVAGLWTATGCNGSGFSFSPAIGQVLAEWIVDGEPSLDITSLAPARFAEQPLDETTLVERAIWQYAHYYDPV